MRLVMRHDGEINQCMSWIVRLQFCFDGGLFLVDDCRFYFILFYFFFFLQWVVVAMMVLVACGGGGLWGLQW